MKKISYRVVSMLLVLALVLSLVPAISVPAKAAYVPTTNQQNIVDRANYMYNLTWVAQETIYGWRYGYTFEKGQTYRLPYAQPINAGYYIGYGVSIEDFLAAAADGSSIYYSQMSEYNSWYSTYYGTDCSAYVSWCWGAARNTTYGIPYISTNYGYATESNIRSYLQHGDALNSNSAGHVVLVTDLTFDESGTLTQIEITEQTPPQLKRSYYTPAELAAKYGSQYTIQRYNGTVPEAPESGYVTQCTKYASHCTLQVTADTPVMTLPCTAMVDDSAAVLQTAAVGESWTAIGLYKNTEDELWYQVSTESGEEGYILASNTAYVDENTEDITITGAAVPNGHLKGNYFYVEGVISAQYNKLTTASVYIYQGFGLDGTQITGYTDTVSGNYYSLKYSNIDNNTAFNKAGLGENTYVIYTDYVNYYVQDGEVKSNSGRIYLVEEYFMVISSSVSQSTCTHTYSDTTTIEADCTQDGAVVHACSTCGYIYTETITGGHAYGEWTVQEATCVTDGSRTRTCTLCGEVQTEVITAGGHSYDEKMVAGDCQTTVRMEYTCSHCGDSYYEDTMRWSDWQEAMPDMDESLIESKTQYRYQQRETVTSAAETLEGYEPAGTDWAAISSGELLYVASWPAGFSTSHELYAQYNNQDLKITASETETAKTEIDSDAIVGYLYYHWCYDGYPYTVATQQGSYNRFHAYYSTKTPAEANKHDTSDDSYRFDDSTACDDSIWYFYVPVYGQKYTNYEKVYVHQRWSEWSDWSDEETVATETCQIETRTVYRYLEAAYGDHAYESVTIDATCTADGGIAYHCTICGDSYTEIIPAPGHSYESVTTEATCTADGTAVYTCACGDSYTETIPATGHSWSEGVCVNCGELKPVKDYYLFGYINGQNYACEEDGDNIGEYKFVDGQLTAVFNSNSYVALKSGDNLDWYMTDGWMGEDVTSVTLYNNNTGIDSNKLFIPGCMEITFTLVDNGDDTFTLSYTAVPCAHETHDQTGACTACGTVVGHSHESVTTEATCTEDGSIVYTCACGDTYTETIPAAGHSYESAVTAPTCTAAGYTTHTCSVCGDNYTDSEVAATGHSHESVTTEATCTEDGSIVYTCGCGDTYTETIPSTGHSYADGVCGTCGGADPDYVEPVVVPELKLAYPSLNFQDIIYYNIYYTVSDMTDVVEMGLMTFSDALSDGTIDNALEVIPGYVASSSNYMSHTNGIPAKNMGDTLYFKAYAKLSDGTYAYSDVAGYSAKKFAMGILEGNYPQKTKSLMVALLNYGAAAQVQFNHNTDNLMNAGLTDEQKAYVEAYSAGMVSGVPTVDSTKAGVFTKTSTGYGTNYPSVEFGGAFAIHYHFPASYTPDGDVTLYYWRAADFDAAEVLTAENATGTVVMSETDIVGTYRGSVTGIAAKEVDEIVYVAGVYESDGVSYCTGVIAYSLSAYCRAMSGSNAISANAKALAEQTAVYGYYAKQYFTQST